MRLIDADIAEKIMSERYTELAKEYGHYDHYTTGYGDALSVIEEAPTIEAEPVKCGLMRIETVDYGTHYRKYYFCPSCNIEIGHKTFDENRQLGQGTVLHSNKFPNYCPNCGAKMESEE